MWRCKEGLVKCFAAWITRTGICTFLCNGITWSLKMHLMWPDLRKPDTKCVTCPELNCPNFSLISILEFHLFIYNLYFARRIPFKSDRSWFSLHCAEYCTPVCEMQTHTVHTHSGPHHGVSPLVHITYPGGYKCAEYKPEVGDFVIECFWRSFVLVSSLHRIIQTGVHSVAATLPPATFIYLAFHTSQCHLLSRRKNTTLHVTSFFHLLKLFTWGLGGVNRQVKDHHKM